MYPLVWFWEVGCWAKRVELEAKGVDGLVVDGEGGRMSWAGKGSERVEIQASKDCTQEITI